MSVKGIKSIVHTMTKRLRKITMIAIIPVLLHSFAYGIEIFEISI